MEDIEKYDNRRFGNAKKIAKSILQKLSELEVKKLEFLRRFLDLTKITVVCEILQSDNQHLVQIGEDFGDNLYFLMFCQSASKSEKPSSLTAFPPLLAVKLAKQIGFVTPKFNQFSGTELKDVCAKVSRERIFLDLKLRSSLIKVNIH